MTTIYLIERQGQPVALADAVGRADALRLYIDSLDVSARVASTRDVLTHRGLPLLQRADEEPERDPLTGDMFGGAQAEVSTEQPAAVKKVAAEQPGELTPAPATSAPAPDSTADLEGQVTALAARASAGRGTSVPVKYRDPASGATWSGRGLRPRWLADALAAGRTLADFEV